MGPDVHKLALKSETDQHTRIIATHHAIIAAKSGFSFYSHINRLSDEVLAEIFFLLKDSSRSGDNDKLPQWIRVSHICRRWRLVAVNLPRLWDNPPMLNADALAVMLGRAKVFGLTIHLCAATPQFRKLHSIIQQVA